MRNHIYIIYLGYLGLLHARNKQILQRRPQHALNYISAETHVCQFQLLQHSCLLTTVEYHPVVVSEQFIRIRDPVIKYVVLTDFETCWVVEHPNQQVSLHPWFFEESNSEGHQWASQMNPNDWSEPSKGSDTFNLNVTANNNNNNNNNNTKVSSSDIMSRKQIGYLTNMFTFPVWIGQPRSEHVVLQRHHRLVPWTDWKEPSTTPAPAMSQQEEQTPTTDTSDIYTYKLYTHTYKYAHMGHYMHVQLMAQILLQLISTYRFIPSFTAICSHPKWSKISAIKSSSVESTAYICENHSNIRHVACVCILSG